MKSLIKYLGIGALVLSIGGEALDLPNAYAASNEKEGTAELVGKPVSVSSAYDDGGYFSIAWDINQQEDIISCHVSCRITLTRAVAVVERIIKENWLKNMPERVTIKGHYEKNEFYCDTLSAKKYKIDLDSWK